MIVFEELGRALACAPCFATMALATPAILLAGTDADRARWLPALAAGEVTATLAWLEDGGPIVPPPRIGRHQVGDVARVRGRDCWIRDIVRERDRVDVTLWFEDGTAERLPGESLDG